MGDHIKCDSGHRFRSKKSFSDTFGVPGGPKNTGGPRNARGAPVVALGLYISKQIIVADAYIQRSLIFQMNWGPLRPFISNHFGVGAPSLCVPCLSKI